LEVNKPKPEAQDDFMEERAFASGMKTDVGFSTFITYARGLSYFGAQGPKRVFYRESFVVKR